MAMVVPETNEYNRRYLEAKHDRMDHQNLEHLFDDSSSEEVPLVDESFFEESGEVMATNAVKMSLTAFSEEDDESDDETGWIISASSFLYYHAHDLTIGS